MCCLALGCLALGLDKENENQVGISLMPPPRKILAAMRVVIGSKGAGAGLGRGELWPGTSCMLNKVARITWERSRVFMFSE